MNTRSAARELAFLAISQISQKTELDAEILVLAATRTLRDLAKKQLKSTKRTLQELGKTFFELNLNEEIKDYQVDYQKLLKATEELEEAYFEIKESLDLPEFLNQPSEAKFFAIQLVDKYRKNKQTVNQLIAQTLQESLQEKKWLLERVNLVDKLILRVGCTELMFVEETPHVVIIDEAIKLAQKYSTEDSPKFINGVLRDLYFKIHKNL